MLRTVKLMVIVAILVIAVTAAVTAYYYIYRSPSEKPEGSDNFIIVKDFADREVKVPKNIQRVVAIGPGMLRLVSYLNALDLIVGVEESEQRWSPIGRDYAMAYIDRLKTLPIIGPGGPRNPPDPEKIRAVKPDLVIMFLGYAQLYDPDRLSSEVGAPVVVVDYSPAGFLDLEPMKRALTLLGKVLDRENRARQLIEFIDTVVKDLTGRTSGVSDRPKVYVGAVSYAGKRPFTASQVGFPPLLMLNTRSIADDVGEKPGFVELSFEYIIQKQPDVIFIDLNNLDVVLDDFSKDSAKYCALKAFREGKIYAILPFNYYHTNIATALADAYYMGKVLYPEKFADVDPMAKANEIFRMFLGKELYEEFVKGLGRGFKDLSDVFRCG